jgi:hypothetical protein
MEEKTKLKIEENENEVGNEHNRYIEIPIE